MIYKAGGIRALYSILCRLSWSSEDPDNGAPLMLHGLFVHFGDSWLLGEVD